LLLHEDRKRLILSQNKLLIWVGDTGIEPVTSSV
jgi:hypothetical protein